MTPLGTFGANLRKGMVVHRIVGEISVRALASDLNALFNWAFFPMGIEALAANTAPELKFDLFPYATTGRLSIREGDVAAQGNKMIKIPIDIKPRYRFRSVDDSYMFQAENTSNDTVSVEFEFFFRLLVRVP